MHPDPFEATSDAALVVSVARRDERALAEIYRRHADSLTALARRVLRDPQLAADVVQEVFVRLWQRPERFDAERGALRAYLLADAHGRSVDLVRAEGARRRREEREIAYRLDEPVTTPDEEVIARIESAEMRAALDSLTSDERAAIELAYFGGRSYREVAALLSEPEGTIKSRIRSGLVKLRGTVVAALAVLA